MTTYELPDLPYAYSALEPKISARAMEIHHSKHHAKYVQGTNATLKSLTDAADTEIPGLEHALAFNLGGHLLHSLYWQCMTPDGEQRPEGGLLEAINESFGSYERLTERLTASITTVQGSGWGALMWEPLGQRLVVAQLRDHQGEQIIGAQPLLIADSWEHAYYLDYQSDKAAWAKAFLSVADWSGASRRFDLARQSGSPIVQS